MDIQVMVSKERIFFLLISIIVTDLIMDEFTYLTHTGIWLKYVCSVWTLESLWTIDDWLKYAAWRSGKGTQCPPTQMARPCRR